MYEWNDAFREGMTLYFGVSWYDRDFFEARKEAYTSKQHASIFERFGVSASDFKVEHKVVG